MKISFCIPTFNRSQMLQETLSSIIYQQTKDIEIVVCDNCSTDDTERVIDHALKVYKNISYFRWKTQVECGQNLLKSVELASGEYCWLLTDDDRLEEGAVEEVRIILQKHKNLAGISVNVEGYDRFFRNKKKIRYSHNVKKSKKYNSLNNAYIDLGAWFGYWSAHIVKKSLWEKASDDSEYKQYIGYHHLYLILKMIQIHPQWYFSSKKCVGYRADNESFSEEYGKYQRYFIDLYTYSEIGKAFFGNYLKAANKVCLKVLKSHSLGQIISMKLDRVSTKLLLKVLKLSFQYYRSYPIFWFKLLPVILIPRCFMLLARYIYRKFKKNEPSSDSCNTHLQQSELSV